MISVVGLYLLLTDMTKLIEKIVDKYLMDNRGTPYLFNWLMKMQIINIQRKNSVVFIRQLMAE